MRVYDLYFVEAVDPLLDIVNHCMDIVDKSVDSYLTEVEKINDGDWIDDSDVLVALLEENSDNTIFSWNITPEGNGDPIDWYIHSAAVTESGHIHFNLDATTIDSNFGPKTFNKVIKKTVEHESIHLHQKMIMGEELFGAIPSGFTKGEALLENTSNTQDLFDEYFSDPTEIMAHGHDLAVEMLDQEVKMKDLSENLDKLPTLHRHVHRGFSLEHPVTKRVIGYSNEYMTRMAR